MLECNGQEETGSCVCVCLLSECGEAKGSDRHRAGSSWGIQQRQTCLRDRMQSLMGFLPTGGNLPPGRASPIVLHISTILSSFQQPAGPDPVAKSIIYSLH